MDVKVGDLVFLTEAYENFIMSHNPLLRVSLVNRLAKVEDIIDWDSDKGKRIKEARLKTGKWDNLPLEDCRYILSVFYHDLEGRNGKKGVIERGVCLFSVDPKTKKSFFQKVPDWVYQEIMKKAVQFEVL